jgi:hypothetical protein
MNCGSSFRVLAVFLIAAACSSQAAPAADKPTQSEHRAGPDGLEGWTLNYTIPDHPNERFPMTLVIARKDQVIRKIDGNGFVWNWMFWAGGKQVAYESGPLHFGMACILADVASGKQLASYDRFQGVPDDAPDWLKALGKAP